MGLLLRSLAALPPGSCAVCYSSRRSSEGGMVPLVQGSNGLCCRACPMIPTDLIFTVVVDQQGFPLLHFGFFLFWGQPCNLAARVEFVPFGLYRLTGTRFNGVILACVDRGRTHISVNR